MEDGRTTGLIRTIERLFSEPAGLSWDLVRRGIEWLDPIIFILLVVVVARLAAALVDRAVTRVELPDRVGRLEFDQKQVVTLRQFLRSALAYAVYFIAFAYVLATLGIDPSPFLVGASGLVAIAIGFGSQGLVQDVVTGIFILMERQYSVGDFVEIGSVSGFVEDVGIRVTRVRDVNGALRLVPNRTITTVGNYPKGYVEAIVDVFPKDPGRLDRVEALVAEVGRRLDDELDVVLTPPKVSRPLQAGGSHFARAVVRILPLQHWAIDRELVTRLTTALETEGIALAPGGIRVVYQCDRIAFYNNLNRIKSRWSEGG